MEERYERYAMAYCKQRWLDPYELVPTTERDSSIRYLALAEDFEKLDTMLGILIRGAKAGEGL